MIENEILLELLKDGKTDDLPPSLKMRLGYILLEKAKKPDNEKDADLLKIELEKDPNSPHALISKGYKERIEKDDNLHNDDD